MAANTACPENFDSQVTRSGSLCVIVWPYIVSMFVKKNLIELKNLTLIKS